MELNDQMVVLLSLSLSLMLSTVVQLVVDDKDASPAVVTRDETMTRHVMKHVRNPSWNLSILPDH